MSNYIDTICKGHEENNVEYVESAEEMWLHAIEAGACISSSSNVIIDRPTATAVNLVPQDMLVVRTRKYPLTIRVQTHGCFRSITLHKHVIRVHEYM